MKIVTELIGTRPWRRVFNCFAVTLIVAAFLSGGLASAQSGADEAWYKRFANSIGKLMFFYAWPTDTYDHMEFGRIEWKPNGADVSVVLYGTSWLEGKTWAEAVVEIRNAQVTNLRWGPYHALWAPGSFVKAAVDAVDKEYKRQQAQQAPQPAPPPPAADQAAVLPPLLFTRVAVVCLNNPTRDPIVYTVPSEQIWASKTIAPGETWMYSHDGSGDFTVSFNALKTSSAQKTVHLKGAMQASKPSFCDEKMIYEFVVDGQRVGLAPRTWVPGTEHPFTPYVLRGDEGKWVCAAGYKWASTDEHDITCIPNNMGLIGVTLDIGTGASFPTITSVRPGTPAGRAGVPSGSYLVRVNGESMQGLSIDDVVARTRGSINTAVRIGVLVPGRDQIQFFDLTRE